MSYYKIRNFFIDMQIADPKGQIHNLCGAVQSIDKDVEALLEQISDLKNEVTDLKKKLNFSVQETCSTLPRKI